MGLARRNRIDVTLGVPTRDPLGPGRHALGAHVLFVPADLPDGPLPLVVLLHGAGGNPTQVLAVMADEAEDRKVLVLAPKSRGATWGAIRGDGAPDAAAIAETLARAAERFSLDEARLAVAGFSDGASYALALGLANGALFRHVLAFAPGFVPGDERAGRPAIFISHGLYDRVLPIDRCSRQLVPALRAAGYAVTYREFDGGHAAPRPLVAAALDTLV
jgi:predicted esterase